MHTCTHHADCCQTDMARAVAACEAKGLRLTDTRRKVLEILWQNHKAFTAAEVMQQMGNDQPPITYRALEFLEKAGLIHHITSLNAYVGCPHPEQAHQSQLLICGDCHTVTEIHSGKLESQMAEVAKQHDFTVREQHVEVLGQCADCRDHA